MGEWYNGITTVSMEPCEILRSVFYLTVDYISCIITQYELHMS